MSIVSMADAKVQAREPEATRQGRAACGSPADDPQPVDALHPDRVDRSLRRCPRPLQPSEGRRRAKQLLISRSRAAGSPSSLSYPSHSSSCHYCIWARPARPGRHSRRHYSRWPLHQLRLRLGLLLSLTHLCAPSRGTRRPSEQPLYLEPPSSSASPRTRSEKRRVPRPLLRESVASVGRRSSDGLRSSFCITEE